MKKHPVIKDERIEKLDGKVAGELVLGMFFFLAISVFFKVYILRLSLLAYLPEGTLLILVGLYALLRRLSLGIDFFGQRESMASMLSMLYLLKMFFAMVLFIFGSLTMDKISLFLNGKRQAKLDQELEDEE